LPIDASSNQYVDEEYMMADEYDALIEDPSDFYLRVYMPRIFRALEPFRKLAPFTTAFGMGGGFTSSFIMPDVRAALQSLIDVGAEIEKWTEVVGQFRKEAVGLGYPSFQGSMAFAPFDVIGDTMRGVRGIMTDMYRQPDKLMEALDKVASLTIKAAVSAANASGGVATFFPLHKGDDRHMSVKQYETFYWPTLKKVILGLIDEGIVPYLAAEGRFTDRLEIIKDLPRGKVLWWFDDMDMARAKEVLGDTACIAGNVPASLLMTGSPQAVKEYCRQLIETCGKGGGYILMGETHIESGNPDNLQAMIEAAKEYGVYRK
jgi:uroporphyrinogen-III decarboxylase